MVWYRQLGHKFKSFGRQLGSDVKSFGRQLSTGTKLLPQAFKDTSKIYSNLEKKTQGIPLVPNIFGAAASGTQSIGDLLSGNFGKAYQGGKNTLSQGKGVMAQGAQLGIL